MTGSLDVISLFFSTAAQSAIFQRSFFKVFDTIKLLYPELRRSYALNRWQFFFVGGYFEFVFPIISKVDFGLVHFFVTHGKNEYITPLFPPFSQIKTECNLKKIFPFVGGT